MPAIHAGITTPNLSDLVANAEMNFGRTSDGGEIFSELEAKHVRRWIPEANGAVKIERIATELGFESLR